MVLNYRHTYAVLRLNPFLALEDICDAQTADDSLRPVIQALSDRVKPPQENLRDYPEEARILFAQWDSLVLENNVLYRRHHYPVSRACPVRFSITSHFTHI